MIEINCLQGTLEWHQARCGVNTASTFSTAVDEIVAETRLKLDGTPYKQRERLRIEIGKALGWSQKWIVLKYGRALYQGTIFYIVPFGCRDLTSAVSLNHSSYGAA